MGTEYRRRLIEKATKMGIKSPSRMSTQALAKKTGTKCKSKSKKEVRAPNTVREMLDLLDEFFVHNNHVKARALWDVLSALRGPDNGSLDLKNNATIPIRRAAFPKLSRISPTPIGPAFGNKTYVFRSTACSDDWDHFGSHALAAARVLKLIREGHVVMKRLLNW